MGITPETLGIQTGSVTITPAANTISSVNVTFPKKFAAAPDIVIVSPLSGVPYTTLRYATAADYTASGFTLYVYRTTATSTVVNYMAVGKFN